MKKVKKPKNVKMNLTLSVEFYELLKKNAQEDYIKVATYVKRFLMKNLLEQHNDLSKCLTGNEKGMGC
jgi:hypothetical protein